MVNNLDSYRTQYLQYIYLTYGCGGSLGQDKRRDVQLAARESLFSCVADATSWVSLIIGNDFRITVLGRKSPILSTVQSSIPISLNVHSPP